MKKLRQDFLEKIKPTHKPKYVALEEQFKRKEDEIDRETRQKMM